MLMASHLTFKVEKQASDSTFSILWVAFFYWILTNLFWSTRRLEIAYIDNTTSTKTDQIQYSI